MTRSLLRMSFRITGPLNVVMGVAVAGGFAQRDVLRTRPAREVVNDEQVVAFGEEFFAHREIPEFQVPSSRVPSERQEDPPRVRPWF